MIFRFGRFELDEEKRELRLDGRVQELQPRIFDVLVHLVRHCERVVTKDELLSAVWPGVVVTDSSLMRAVSLIRSTLRDGGEPEAIQTFSRQGYRFKAELGDKPAAPPVPRSIAQARAAAERGEWAEALRRYRGVSEVAQLQAPDFEQWASAALHVGRPQEAVQPLERAVAAYTQNADRTGAARAALSLTNIHLESRALAVAKGWHRRAAAFLTDVTAESRELALYQWLTARIALFESDLPTALAEAKRAEALARRLGDPNIEALGLVYRAHVELATGEIRAGLVHMNEAGAAILAGNVDPWTCGFVFCSVIWAYLDRGDLTGAGEWTDQFVRWSGTTRDYGYPGLCRLHRGEVLCVQGKLAAAESEIRQARELLAESARYAEGDAYRVLGEIRFLRGDYAGAEKAFRQAQELGWHPLPGWALLQEERGQFAAAIKSLQRGLDNPSWCDGQRRGVLLGHLVRMAARAGRAELARETLRELERSTELRTAAGCEAMYRQAQAEVALLDDDARRAETALRQAIAIWQDAGSQINVAHTRLRLATVLVAAGEREDAAMELASAERAFAEMAAKPMVSHCRAERKALSAKSRSATATA